MWDYQRANYEGLKSFLNDIDWNNVCNSFTDVDEAAESWTNTLLDGVRSFIPHKVVTIRLRDKPWYSNSLRRCKRKLDRCHKRAKQRNNEHSWAAFRSETPKNGMKKNRLIVFLKAHLQQKHVGNYTVLFWVFQHIVIVHH